MTKKYVIVKYLLFTLSIYYTVITAYSYGDSSFILIISCLLLISFLYRKKYRDTYVFSLLANVVFGCIMIGVFQKSGSFFDVGGDDSNFYDHFINASDGDSTFLNSRYGNYIRLGVGYIKVLRTLGIDTITPLSVYPLNWFIGANVCVGTFILAQRLGVNEIRARVVSILLSVHPLFIFHEVKILRDVFVALLVLLFILIYTSRWKLIFKIVGLLALIIISSKVRAESILYMLLFIGVDFFFNLFYSDKRYRAYIFACLGLLIVAFGYSALINLAGREVSEINDLASSYQDLRLSSNSDNSLGTKLKNSGPLFSPIVVLYMWLSPFPPPIFFQQSYYHLLMSLGALIWYFAYFKMPLYTFNFYKGSVPSDKKKVVDKLLIYLLVCSIIIALISADPRHLISFYPLMFIAFEFLRQDITIKRQKDINILATAVLMVIIIVYIALKV